MDFGVGRSEEPTVCTKRVCRGDQYGKCNALDNFWYERLEAERVYYRVSLLFNNDVDDCISKDLFID